MKLLAFLFSLSEHDKETIKDWFGFIMPIITLFSNMVSPVIGFLIGVLTVAVLYERWKYYRNHNNNNKPI